jgi:ribosomal protein L37E
LGNPSKINGWMCRCGIRLHFNKKDAVCDACGLKYQKKGDQVQVNETGRKGGNHRPKSVDKPEKTGSI